MSIEDLKSQPVSKASQSDWLLSAEQRAICEQIASGDSLDSKRAKALLAVDDGASQAEAGLQAGLTRNQVKYCLGRFRQVGLAMFQEEMTADALTESLSEPEPALTVETMLAPVPLATVAEVDRMTRKEEEEAGNKTAQGKKKGKKKKDKKGGKKGGKSGSGKSSADKDKKNGKKKGSGKQKGKGQKSKSGKGKRSAQKGKNKGAKKGKKKRNK